MVHLACQGLLGKALDGKPRETKGIFMGHVYVYKYIYL